MSRMPVHQEDFSSEAWRVLSSPAAKRYIDMMEEQQRAEGAKQSSKRQRVGAQLLHSLPMDSEKSTGSNNDSGTTMGAGQAHVENPAGVIGNHLPGKNCAMDEMERAMQDEEFSPERRGKAIAWSNSPSDDTLREVMRALETPPPYADATASAPPASAPLNPSAPDTAPSEPSTSPAEKECSAGVVAPEFLKGILDKNIFLSGKLRKNTFINNAWPRKSTLPPVNSMVMAGFRRSSRTRGDVKKRDAVICDFCNEEFSCFQNRCPFVKHVDESPSCCFVKMFIGSNSSELSSEIENPEWDTSFFEMRRATFQNWPRGVGFAPDTMAERGFLYTGKGDVVTCMFGCCTLANWHCTDIIEKRHKQANPECPVVKILYA